MTGEFERLAFPILPTGREDKLQPLRESVLRKHRQMFHALHLSLSSVRPEWLKRSGAAPLLEALARSSGPARDAVLWDAGFGWWLYSFCRKWRDWPESPALSLLSHSLFLPLAASGGLPECEFFLESDAAARILFPGHPVRLDLGRGGARQKVGASFSGRRLALKWKSRKLGVSLRDLLEGASDSPCRRSELWFLDGFELDGFTPLLQELCRLDGLPSRFLPFLPHSDGELIRARKPLGCALDLLRTVWPEQYRETRFFCRSFVLSEKRNFIGSMDNCNGTIFYRPSGQLYLDFESLIHESGHLKLAHVSRLFPLWTGGSGRPVRSPWSGKYKQAVVIYHALYVYFLSYCGLLRLLELCRSDAKLGAQEDGVRRRLRFLEGGFEDGFKLARRELLLTPEGRRFLDEVEERYRSAVERGLAAAS